MKKALKTLSICCLSITIGIVIGSTSKSLLKKTFNNVNSSPEKVIESYLNAYYDVDVDIMEQCLSTDLNDLEKLEYFGARGSSLARNLINGYNEYLYYKDNPPGEDEEELAQLVKDTTKNIESYGIVKAYVENKVKGIEDDHKYLEDSTGKGIKGTVVDIKFMEEESDINKDPDYIKMGVFITKDNGGEQSYDDRNIVLQKKKDKYYILDI